MTDDEFQPDWGSPPGDTIQECLDRLGMTRADLGSLLGIGPDEVDSLMTGQTRITHVIADALFVRLGGSREFWMARDAHYVRYLNGKVSS